MKKCLVIQPFDNGKFDKRYKDIYKPAIEKANLFPYRVDNDPSSRVPIEDIERNILDSQICFAEITTDNPNVWYELGFAFASGKDVVMVSEAMRNGGLPFDIRHRMVIHYNTETTSEYEKLGQAITNKINALIETQKQVKQILSNPISSLLGLKGTEIAILKILMQNQFTDEDSYSIYSLKGEMEKAGFDDFDTNIGLRMLKAKKMVTVAMENSGWNNNEIYASCKMTEVGIIWVIENQDNLGPRNNKSADLQIDSNTDNNELPF